MTKDREGPIHRAILQYLRMQYPGALIFHPANEIASKMPGATDMRRMLAQKRAKAMGMLPGVGDLIMLHRGSFYMFEVKAPGNYQQKNQHEVQAVVEANGGRYFVVRSIDDVREAMWGASDVVSVPMRGEIS